MGIGALVLVCCAWSTAQRAQDWRSDVDLWTAAARSSPSLPRPALNTAMAYARIGAWPFARLWMQRAVQLVAAERKPEQRQWITFYLCRALTRFAVFDPAPVSYSVSCAS